MTTVARMIATPQFGIARVELLQEPEERRDDDGEPAVVDQLLHPGPDRPEDVDVLRPEVETGLERAGPRQDDLGLDQRRGGGGGHAAGSRRGRDDESDGPERHRLRRARQERRDEIVVLESGGDESRTDGHRLLQAVLRLPRDRTGRRRASRSSRASCSGSPARPRTGCRFRARGRLRPADRRRPPSPPSAPDDVAGPNDVGPDDPVSVRLAVAEADDRPSFAPPRPSSRAARRPPARGTDRSGRRRASAREGRVPSGRAPAASSVRVLGTSTASAETTSPPRFESSHRQDAVLQRHLPRLASPRPAERRPARPAPRARATAAAGARRRRRDARRRRRRRLRRRRRGAAPASAAGRPGSRGSGWRPRGRKPWRDVSNPRAAPRRAESGDRVEPARVERVATGQAADREPRPSAGGRGGGSTSRAYSEQVGWNRQAGGRSGETNLL